MSALVRARFDERPRHAAAVKERCESRSVGSRQRRIQSVDEAAEKELGAPVDEGADGLADQEASEIVVVINRAGDPKGSRCPKGGGEDRKREPEVLKTINRNDLAQI